MSLVRPRLLARLRLDLEELHGSPYPGVEVIPDEQDLRKMCLLLSPPAGPWKGLRLHFDVELPTNWPTSPPQIKNSVHGIDHPNLFGDYVCCDLLREPYHRETGYLGGYTPALTLRGLFLQLMTFFSSAWVEQEYNGLVYIGEAEEGEVFYHYESEVIDRLMSTQYGYRYQPSAQDLRKREQEWHAESSEEVLIYQYDSGESQVTQTTKRGMQNKPAAARLIKSSSSKVNPRFTNTAALLSHWQCKKCEYGTPAMPHRVDSSNPSQQLTPPDSPPRTLIVPPPVCFLPKLNDDVLYVLADHLPTESLLSFSIAYPRLHHVITEGHVLLQRELRCFFLRTPLRTATLGIGIEHDAQARTLHSDFDWLSQEAFDGFAVRKSVHKRPFEHFLPLAFGNVHFNRARKEVWKALCALDDHINCTERLARPPPAKPLHPLLATGPRKNTVQSVRVLFKFMNNIVVSLMKSCDGALSSSQTGNNAALLHASEKAIVAYCQLFHLLICLCVSAPDVIIAATQCIKAFITEPRSRHKDQLADLGEFIVLATLVLAVPPVKLPGQTKPPPVIGWKTHLNGPLLEEVLIRNARWVLKEVPGLEVYERGESDYRLAQTFYHSRTSLRLVMFQIAFLDLITAVPAGHTTNLARRLGRSYGFPEKVNPSDKSIPEQMVERIKAIYKVQSWPEFFDRVQYANGRAWGKERFSGVLRECMQESGKRGYHRAAMGGRLDGLKSDRNLREREWNEQTLKQARFRKGIKK